MHESLLPTIPTNFFGPSKRVSRCQLHITVNGVRRQTRSLRMSRMLSLGGLPCMPLLARSRATMPPKFSAWPTRIYAPSPKLEGVRQQRVKAERHCQPFWIQSRLSGWACVFPLDDSLGLRYHRSIFLCGGNCTVMEGSERYSSRRCTSTVTLTLSAPPHQAPRGNAQLPTPFLP